VIQLVFDVGVGVGGVEIVLPPILAVKPQKQILSYVSVEILKPRPPNPIGVE
jgi:hypothetical protein